MEQYLRRHQNGFLTALFLGKDTLVQLGNEDYTIVAFHLRFDTTVWTHHILRGHRGSIHYWSGLQGLLHEHLEQIKDYKKWEQEYDTKRI